MSCHSTTRNRSEPSSHPAGQRPIALPAIYIGNRRPLNREDVSKEILAVQSNCRVSHAAGSAGIEDRTAVADTSHRSTLATMFPAEVQPLRDHVKGSVQGKFCGEDTVGEVVAAVKPRSTEHTRSHDTAFVIAPSVEEHAPEPVRSAESVGRNRVVDEPLHRAGGIDYR